MSRFFGYIKISLDRFPPEKRTSIVITFFIMTIACAALLIWAFRPQYRGLYSSLSLEDAAKIVDLLEEEQVPYKLEQEGRRIMVPSKDVYAIRLRLAEAELPKKKGSGWELFDKTSLGVTDFVQKLNYRRGLEGELARTILQLDPIEAVRVHLVMPEESLFRESQKKTMASVMVRMHKGHSIAAASVEGITYLVSSAVEGLEPENVTVIDSRGRMLSRKMAEDEFVRLSSTQWEIQQQVEKHLQSKGQSLLDRRFGPGKSAIQVTAELDFRQLERTSEIYDPDNPSTRSEEFTTTTSVGSDTSSSSNEHNITNYELNLTRERLVNSIGGMKRMTVAVMVDGNYVKAEPGTENSVREFVPLPAVELNALERTIMLALGYKEDRGDQISVVSVPFLDADLVEEQEIMTMNRWELLMRHSQKIITVIAVLLMLLMVRSFLKRAQEAATVRLAMQQQLAGDSREGKALPPPIDIEQDMTEEARGEAMLQEQVTRFVDDNPEVAAKLVRSWLVEL